MANLEQQNQKNKNRIVRHVESDLIGLQITFCRESEIDPFEPTGLVMYNYITKCFMVVSQKMHGKFFGAIVEAERQKLLEEQRAEIAEHYANHIARELTGNY